MTRWLDGGWQERGLAALRATLDVDARTRKAMIQYLFDEGFWDEKSLTWPAAIARWNDCLNPTKNSFFKIGELWALMARFDRHDLFAAMADDLGYELRRKPTEERRQALLERVANALERVERELGDAQQQLARLGDEPAEPVRLTVPGTPARFALDDDVAPGGF